MTRNLYLSFFCIILSLSSGRSQNYQFLREISNKYDPKGIASDPDGNFYVIDAGNYIIEKFDNNGGFISNWGGKGSNNGQFISPQAIAVDGNGFVFVAEEGRIQKFDANGTYISKWGSLGSDNGQFNSPSGICIDIDGNIYVSDTKNNRIQKFNSNFTFLLSWNIRNPKGISTDNSGNILAISAWDFNVQKFTNQGVLISNIGTFSTNFELLENSGGLCVDKNDFIYAVDAGPNLIQKFDGSGNFIAQIGSYGRGPNDLWEPSAIAVDPNGNLAIVDYGNKRVQKYEPIFESFSFNWSSSKSLKGQLNYPSGVVLDKTNNIYVLSPGGTTGNKHVQVFDITGNSIKEFGLHGQSDGQLFNPIGIASDNLNNIYVADYLNHRIQKFDQNGNLLLKFGTLGINNGQFSGPVNLALNKNNDIYVVDQFNKRIQVFTPSGIYSSGWKSFDFGNTEFLLPFGIAIDSEENVYITDEQKNTVRKCDKYGNFINEWGSFGSNEGQFNTPKGIAIDKENNLYIADYNNHRIQKFNSSGQFLEKWGGFGDSPGYFKFPQGVTIDEKGKVYITDSWNNRVQIFTPYSEWNGTTWSPSIPDANTNAEINEDYNINDNGNFSCKDLTINAGKSFLISAGTTFNVSGNLINNGMIVNCGILNIAGSSSGTGTIQTSKYKIDTQPVFCSPALTFSVPIKTIGNISPRLIALDFDLNYDATKITPTGTATIGPVSTSYATYDLNIATPGKVGVSLYLNGAPVNTYFSGNGTVININFRINTGVSPGDIISNFNTSNIIESKLFTSNIVCPVTSGDFTFTRSFVGQIQYRETSYKKINGTTGTNPTSIFPFSSEICSDNALISPDLNAQGIFYINEVTLKSLQIDRQISGDASISVSNCTNIQSVINSADRTMASQIANGSMTQVNIFQLLSADVNLDGRVTSGDAALISSRTLNQYNCEFPQSWNYQEDPATGAIVPKQPYFKSKDWLFLDAQTLATTPFTSATRFKVPSIPNCLPVNTDLTSCGNSTLDQTYHAILLGDVNNSWTPSVNSSTIRNNANNTLVLSIKDSKIYDQFISIPISFESEDSITGIDFTWNYDTTKFTVISYESTPSYNNLFGSLSNNIRSANRLMATSYVLDKLVKTQDPIAYITLRKNSDIEIIKEDFNDFLAVVNGELTNLRIEENQVITGSKENVIEKLEMFPNPASKTVYFNGLKEDFKFEIRNISSQIQSLPSVSGNSLNISGLQSGVYFVRAFNTNSSKTFKLVIE